MQKSILLLGSTIATLLGTTSTALACSSYNMPDGHWKNSGIYIEWGGNTQGGNVIAVQEMLQTAGYSPGTIDGYYGTNTENVIRSWQSAQGLTQDGAVGPNTWYSFSVYLQQAQWSSTQTNYEFSPYQGSTSTWPFVDYSSNYTSPPNWTTEWQNAPSTWNGNWAFMDGCFDNFY